MGGRPYLDGIRAWGWERVLTTLTTKQMTLQMFGVEIGLRAVRAREFPICVLCGDHRVLGGSRTRRGDSGSPRSARENPTAALGAHDVRRGLEIVEHARVRQHVRLPVRGHNRLHVLEAVWGHRSQCLRHAALHGGGGNGLRMGHGRRRLRHHGGACAILRWLLLVGGRGDHLVAPLAAHLGEAVQRICGAGSVGRSRCPRRVRRAVGVDVHARRLEGRQRLGEIVIVVLELLGRDDGERRVWRIARTHSVRVVLVHDWDGEGRSRSEEQ